MSDCGCGTPVSFSYGEESSGGGIRNVNLTINTGEFVLLTGESGCGKTTITRLVNGLVPHYYEGNLEGDVLLDGKSVSDTPLYEDRKSTRLNSSHITRSRMPSSA